MTLDEQLVRYAKDLARIYTARERTESAWGETLIALLERRIPLLKGHHRRVAFWSQHLNQALGTPLPPKTLVQAALLHDVGLLALPDAIVQDWAEAVSEKRLPNPYTRERFVAHAKIGGEVLSRLPGFEEAADWIRHHHDAWSRGYAESGLHGEAIPLGARILAVAEVFDYFTHLQKRLSLPAARERLQSLAAKRLDPQLVQAFLELPLEALLENFRWVQAHEGLDY